MGSSGEFAEYPRWSPDGKQIVYDWVNKNGDELRIIGLNGSKPRIIYHNEEVSSIRPFDWSPDGKQILAHFEIKDGTSQIMLVSTADGSVHVLKPIEKGWPTNMNFSPDSRYIVYDFPQKGDSPGSDISLLSTDGNREIPLVEHPADDYVLGWTPDGKNILFTSNRTGNIDIWSIQVSDGKPQGDPKLVKQDMGQFRPIGFTRDGSFYYRYGGLNIFDVYTATLDPETGKILVPPEKAVKRFEGYNQYPSYSPDGKYLVYISVRSSVSLGDGKSAVLCIRSLETGKEREFPLNYLGNISLIASPRWSPDCRSIIFTGQKGNRWLIIRIDAQTGDITPIVIRENVGYITSLDWSRDGKTVFYGCFNPEIKICQILVRDIESGTERVLLSPPVTENIIISLSPDGRSLALLNMSQKRVLKVMSADGGEPRELFTWEQPYAQWGSIAWSADGKYILFSRHQREKKEWDLCRIPVNGGEPQNLGLTVTGWGIRHLSVHPDGRHIAWSAMTLNSGSTDPSVWVMENFLPK